MIGSLSSITDKIRQEAKLVTENSKYVKINYDALNKFINEIYLELKNWNYEKFLDPEIHYIEDPTKAVWYFFVLDSVNFCFWAEKKSDKWTLKYKDQEVSGYKALALALKKEAQNSSLFIYPFYWAKIFKKEFMRMIYPFYEDLFYLKGELKLIEERVTKLRELGENIFGKPLSDMYKNIFLKELEEKNLQAKIKEEEEDPYKLSYSNKNNPNRIWDIIIQANRDVDKLLKIITDTFYNFRDKADYQLNNGKVIEIGFYKRAQLLIHDLYLLYQYYKNKPDILKNYPYLVYLDFKNINKLTAFADYKLPQLLHYKGVLVYSQDLLNEIESGKIIPQKDTKEVEIRASTIVAVEEIANKTKTYPAFIDNFLWNLSQKYTNMPPYHKTITIYY